MYKVFMIFPLVLGLGACASTSEITKLQNEVAQIRVTANDAQQTAQEALIKCNNIDKVFKKSQYK